ncbi:MAG TPA: rRNA maturation RNase YbeY [Bacteroidia bacterium]|jgi:probable rRNA maturation factor|nr:rRNA maturation RNase YbeY [Bacteroidia bacterium]
MAVYFSSTVKIKTPAKKALSAWVEKIVASEKRALKTISYTFCTDEELLQKNRQFLNHSTYTDIITFDYSEENSLSGEIYISTERVRENAEKFNVRFTDELMRVMAHGVLHLCGYKDKSPIQQKQMRAAENRAIRLFNPLTS